MAMRLRPDTPRTSPLHLADRSSPNLVEVRRRRREAAQETRAASMLSPEDARSIFAAAVKAELEGGRAAILRPERRRALVAAATGIGLRLFDANLVIAVVQDAARQARPHPERDSRLGLIHAARPRTGARWALPVIAALVLALVLFLLLVAAVR